MTQCKMNENFSVLITDNSTFIHISTVQSICLLSDFRLMIVFLYHKYYYVLLRYLNDLEWTVEFV